MADKKINLSIVEIEKPFGKQIEFFNSDKRYTAYGGARGGGKSFAARIKAVLLAFNYDGIQILLLRRTLSELRENHVIPLKKLLKDSAKYRETGKSFIFPNESRIVLGYCKNESDVLQYQGQSYDVIFMEEATQFTEFQFLSLTECNRSSGLCKEKFVPRMYFTCNPGGVGHVWVKRLFIDKNYKKTENPNDYLFVKSLVYDNPYILNNSPDYVRTLENLPEDRKKAMLYGDWDIFSGQYFSEFQRDIHVVKPFEIPKTWRRYFTMDYGLDMLAGYFIALDENNKAYVYREIYESGLIITDAAQRILSETDSEIYEYIAPPDMWNKRQETGKSVAEIFSDMGIYLTKANNNRVMGFYNMKEWLRVYTNEFGKKESNFKIFENCKNLIRCLPQIQYDTKNTNDVAKEPHEITHSIDSIRYFISGRPTPYIENKSTKNVLPFELTSEDEYENKEDYIEW